MYKHLFNSPVSRFSLPVLLPEQIVFTHLLLSITNQLFFLNMHFATDIRYLIIKKRSAHHYFLQNFVKTKFFFKSGIVDVINFRLFSKSNVGVV